MTSSLPNAAFKTPSGKKVLIVLNESNTASTFAIKFHGKTATAIMPAGSVGTFVW